MWGTKSVPIAFGVRHGFSTAILVLLVGCSRTGLDVPSGSGVGGEDGATACACASDEDIAHGDVGVPSVVADCDAVFWTTADGVLHGRDASGERVLAKSFYSESLALDATNVYGGSSEILAIPRAGGSVTTVAKIPCVWMRLRDETIYCVTPANDSSSVVAVSLAAPSSPPMVLVDHLDRPQGLAVDEENVYVSASQSILSAKRSLPASQQTPTVLATTVDVDVVDGVAVDDENVYFLDRRPGYVAFSVPKTGGPTTPLLPSAGMDPIAIAVDASSVYVSLVIPSSILELDRVPLDGSGTVTVIDGTSLDSTEIGEEINAIQATPTALYYAFVWDATKSAVTVRKKCE